MKMDNRADEQVKMTLLNMTNDIEPSEGLFEKIKNDIYEKECEETMKIKTTSFKKGKRLTTLVASFMLICSVSAIGVTMVKGNTWVGHSNHKYKSFPSQEKILKDVGFSPKYTKSLPGGFEYVNGGVGESKLLDNAEDILTKTKDINLSYERKSDKSTIGLSIKQIGEEFLDDKESQLVGDFNGINLYYYQQKYKFVPEDYELTEEDKIAIESGELEVSYGTSEISISDVQGLSWYEDGLEYMIMGSDHGFTVEEMLDMATVIIKQ